MFRFISILVSLLFPITLFSQDSDYKVDCIEDDKNTSISRLTDSMNTNWLKQDTITTLSYLDSLIHVDTKEPGYYFEKAFIYNQLNDYCNSLSNISDAIELSGADNSGYDLEYLTFRGMLYFNNQEYKLAVEDFEYVYTHDKKGDIIDVISPLGITYILLNKKDKGCRLLKEALNENRIDKNEYFEHCK